MYLFVWPKPEHSTSATVGITVPLAVLTILSFSPWLVVPVSCAVAFPAILACRVFRQIKLKAVLMDGSTLPTLETLEFTTNSASLHLTRSKTNILPHGSLLAQDLGGDIELSVIVT